MRRSPPAGRGAGRHLRMAVVSAGSTGVAAGDETEAATTVWRGGGVSSSEVGAPGGSSRPLVRLSSLTAPLDSKATYLISAGTTVVERAPEAASDMTEDRRPWLGFLIARSFVSILSSVSVFPEPVHLPLLLCARTCVGQSVHGRMCPGVIVHRR